MQGRSGGVGLHMICINKGVKRRRPSSKLLIRQLWPEIVVVVVFVVCLLLW